jgi:enoyl-[acyl-carrier protein] reductase III
MSDSGPLASGEKVALVTGGSRGLGREIAQHLGRSGHHVVINYRRNVEHAEEAAELVRAHGVRAEPVQADLEDPAAIEAMFDVVREEFGHLDVMVANAAATSFKPMMDLSVTNVQRTLNLVVGGFVRLCQLSAPLMAGRQGRIVGISGIDSFRYMPGHGLLGAAKAAMESLIRSFAMELGPDGITVNGVCPGGFETDSSRIWGGSEYLFLKERFTSQSAVKDFGTVGDMAAVVGFLASPEARFLTGQTIVVDGGLSVNLGELDPLKSATRQFDQGLALS